MLKKGTSLRLMGPVGIRHSIRENASHSVDTAGWQAKMVSIELWIQWCNAYGPHLTLVRVAVDKNGFRRMKDEGQIYKTWLQDF